MPDTDTIVDAIADNAVNPASMAGDGQSVTEHSLPNQIAAAKFVAAERAVQMPFCGLRFMKLVPPGVSR